MTEQQLARTAKRRLAILRHAEEITGNVALTCRYYGISRQCFYTWRRRTSIGGHWDRLDPGPQPLPVQDPAEMVGLVGDQPGNTSVEDGDLRLPVAVLVLEVDDERPGHQPPTPKNSDTPHTGHRSGLALRRSGG